MTWRPAKCLLVLRDEANAAYPHRDKGADGIVGDTSHQQHHSDHNPDAHGVVHAIDLDSDGIPAEQVANALVAIGKTGDPRLLGNGYVIWNRRIASAAHGWAWRPYTGTDPHTGHIHLSCTLSAACDHDDPWNVFGKPTPQPPQIGDTGVFLYSVPGHVTCLFDGGAIAPDQNALNELRRMGIEDRGDTNADFHNWAVEVREGKHTSGKIT